MAAASPNLLTPQEAAVIARCSIKTVRRAYAIGALTAYRRRGSRAVLLDHRDVLAWVHGETLKPVVPTIAELDPMRSGAPAQSLRRQQSHELTAGRPGSHARFDLSAAALRERRATKVESAS